jgi:hypothetical protein
MLVFFLPTPPPQAPNVVSVAPGSTKKVAQLTGEFERSLGPDVKTINQTESRFGLWGTDLGASFEHNGRLWFLFGDTHPVGGHNEFRPPDGDAIAYTRDVNPDRGLRLSFVTAPDGRFKAARIPGVSLAAFEVPTGGFSANGKMYAFYTTDSKPSPVGQIMGRSVLVRSQDNAQTFSLVRTVSTDKFINVSPVAVNNPTIPGLPTTTGQGLLMWASGKEYRRSNPYLAFTPLDGVEDGSKTRYFAGTDPATSQPKWSEKEADAVSLFDHPSIGEISVAWNPHLRKWLMLYNADKPRGINLRTADTPWGPWSESQVLFDPGRDKGYRHFMHASTDSGPDDGLSDPGQEKVWGGEYGPYMIPKFSTGSDGKSTIYFTMSTWNPYNVVLMKATLELKKPGE